MSTADSIVGLGTREDFVAVVPGSDPVRLQMTPDECTVLACVGRACQISEVLDRSGLAEPMAIAVLLSLRAKGAIVPAKVNKPAVPAAAVSAASQEEVELPQDRKDEILELDRKLDSMNHFEVLGVPVGTAADEVRKAYYEKSRRFHPDRFYGKNLGSYRARIDRIFRRLTEAYNVLCTPAARKAYEEANPGLTPAPKAPAETPRPRTPEDEARESERRARFARHPYLAKANRGSELIARAKASIAKGDHAKAYTDLHMASQMDPRNPEVTKLLEESKRKSDQARSDAEFKKAEQAEKDGDLAGAVTGYRIAAGMDVRNARAAYKAAQLMLRVNADPKDTRPLAQRAVDAEPTSADYKVLLGEILLQADMKNLAKRQFEEALKLVPDHPEAKKHLKKSRWPF